MKKMLCMVCILMILIFGLFPFVTSATRFNCSSTECPTGRDRPWCNGDFAWTTWVVYDFWFWEEWVCGVECFLNGEINGGFDCHYFVFLP